MRRDNILFVTEGKNYLNESIIDNLSDNGFKVIQCAAEKEELESATQHSVVGMLLFVDDRVLKAANKLECVKECVLREDIPIFLLGQKEDVDRAMTVLPPHTVRESYIRPIDIKDVAINIRMDVDRLSYEERQSILVVDDSGAYLRSVREWLGDKYQVVLANSGAMAIKSMTLKKPDLVLLDYEMPIVDGKQVLEMIRSETEFSDVPVIFLTGKNDKKSIMGVMSLKPNGYLLKTMDPIEIIRAVDEFFSTYKG